MHTSSGNLEHDKAGGRVAGHLSQGLVVGNDNHILRSRVQAASPHPVVEGCIAQQASAGGKNAVWYSRDVDGIGSCVNDTGIFVHLHEAEGQVIKNQRGVFRDPDASIGALGALEGPGTGIIEVHEEGDISL